MTSLILIILQKITECSFLPNILSTVEKFKRRLNINYSCKEVNQMRRRSEERSLTL